MAALLGLLLSTLVASAPEASAATPEILLGGNRVGEYQAVRGENFLAWQQNTTKDPGHYDVFARPMGGGTAFQVNAPGTNGAVGGIEGDLLVYQQFKGESSSIKFYDLVNRDRSSPPGIDTRQWEYWPSMSGQRILFGRLARDGSREIILYDLATRDETTLADLSGRDTFLAPGQVNGDYAVWYRCTPGAKCDVIRYSIADAEKKTIPNSGHFEYAPSVTPDGVVTFARSGSGCGRQVRLIRYPPSGPASVLWRLPSGGDVGTTRVYVSPAGDTTLYFDNFGCGQPAASDVWQIVEQGEIQLSVEVDGDGSGTVTSSPAGIDCGSDCTERYDPGTGVTLTAAPQGASTFAGWGGACTGTTTTCTLMMDASRSVTATFTTKPVLDVTKSGTGDGTVTSSPAGITCGTDCNEPYNPGTSVTLTAAPQGASTFAGWGGACTGTSTTCTLTMDSSRSVTATFTTKPVLDVTKSGTGDGTVTSVPAGITCGTDCSEPYDQGTSVTLTASPNGTSSFAGWGGACTGTSTTCALTMDASRSVTATFTTKPVLDVTRSGTGAGTVTSSPPGIDCDPDCDQPYTLGTDVTLTANPDPDSEFGGWGGACSGSSPTCLVVMDSSKSVTATFTLKPLLTVSKSGDGQGTVTSSPPGIDCDTSNTDCTESYDTGTNVALTAGAAAGSSFIGWTGCDVVELDGTCTVDMTGARAVTAAFDDPLILAPSNEPELRRLPASPVLPWASLRMGLARLFR